MARIGMLDVDGHHFPNLAQMKISAYHKNLGDHVERFDPFQHYDIVYKSKIFFFSQDYQYPINADKIIQGGTGYALSGPGGEHFHKELDKDLPYEIEHQYPDYSLYNIKDTAYGFLTRGCPRGCQFCIVEKKEGLRSHKVADIQEFWDGQPNINILDPNILASKEAIPLLHSLKPTNATIDFSAGLDIRVMTQEKAEALLELKIKELHFAWDRYNDKDIILPKFQMFSETARRINPKLKNNTTIVYTLVNHSSTLQQDLERIYTLRDLGFWAYVMIYDKPHANPVYRKLQRWCNNRRIFASCRNFDDYNKKEKYNNTDNQQLNIF